MVQKYSNEKLIGHLVDGGPRQNSNAFYELSHRIFANGLDVAEFADQLLDAPDGVKKQAAELLIRSTRLHRPEQFLDYLREDHPDLVIALRAVAHGACPFLPGLLPQLEALISHPTTEVAIVAIGELQDYLKWSNREMPEQCISVDTERWLNALRDERVGPQHFSPKVVAQAAEFVLRTSARLPAFNSDELLAAVKSAQTNKPSAKLRGRLVAIQASCAVAQQDTEHLRELWSVASPTLRRRAVEGAATGGLDSSIADTFDLFGIDLKLLMLDGDLCVRLAVAEAILHGFLSYQSHESKTMKSYRTALFSGNIKKALPALQAIPSQTLSEVDDCRNVALLSVAYLSYPDPVVQLAAAEVLSEATVMQAALPQVACAKGFIEPLLENLETGPLESALRQTVRSIEAENS